MRYRSDPNRQKSILGNLYLSGRKLDRTSFELRVRKLASILQAGGVKPGDPVALLLRNDISYFELIEACRYLQASFVPLNWHGTSTETEHILTDSGATALVVHQDLVANLSQTSLKDVLLLVVPTAPEISESYGLETVLAAQPIADKHNIELLLQDAQPITTATQKFHGMFSYTSGSTGRPKGIKRAMDDSRPDLHLVYTGLAKTLLGLNAGDRFYVTAPLYHSAPNALSLCCIAAQDVEIYIESKFKAEQFLADIEQYKITHTYIVPTMMVRLLKLPEKVRNQYDVSSLRFAISSGSPWPSEIKHAMINWFGPIFYESYGASEIGFMTLISSAEALKKPGSVGKVLPGGAIKILNDDKQSLPAGESGLIYINLPMFGAFTYTNAQGGTEDLHHQGYTTVGDIGYLDSEDYLFINDRKKDMIISGGANIFPAEIEAELIHMPEVLDCAIFGAPHTEFGEMVVAAVQCQPEQSVDLQQVKAFLETKLARFKLPKKLDIHSALPREDSGKIFKQRLRAPYWENHKP